MTTHYDFDTPVARRHSGSYKWDSVEQDDVLPLWVADMDFKAAPAIQEALRRRVEHGVFGYTQVPQSYYEAISSWFERRHQWAVKPEWVVYTSGVLPAIAATLRALALPGEHVVIMTPTYNCFFSSIQNAGCVASESPLLRVGDHYEVDWADLEARCSDDRATLLLLCNPHNPAGRVWTREELERVDDICRRHGVRVLSDEIHGEIVMPGYKYTPFATVSAEAQASSVVFCSPTKGFNLAGLQIANIICADPQVRRHIDRAINIHETCDVNPFGVVALEAAYNESEDWLDAMNDYIWGNYQALKEFFQTELPKVHVVKMEGTYLAWVDITAAELTSDEAEELIMKEGRVYINSGTIYGRRAGQGYLRINLACPRATLMQALMRIGRVLSQYIPFDESGGCPA